MDVQHLKTSEIAFRVLLQREAFRPQLTFADLEQSLPKDIRRRIEPDWRAYIRDESLHFDSAFEKAVRKHLPGVYYEVMAAEFLGKLPFHIALAHFLDPGEFTWDRAGIPVDAIYELAERFINDIRHRRAQTKKQVQPAAVIARPVLKPTEPKRRCAFCKQLIRVSELSQHVDRHINPPQLGGGQITATITASSTTEDLPAEMHIQERSGPALNTGQEYNSTSVKGFERFGINRCISCGNIAIPGDYYCYHHAPD